MVWDNKMIMKLLRRITDIESWPRMSDETFRRFVGKPFLLYNLKLRFTKSNEEQKAE